MLTKSKLMQAAKLEYNDVRDIIHRLESTLDMLKRDTDSLVYVAV